jgi:hypothetical protein
MSKIGSANKKRRDAVQAQLVPDTFMARFTINVAEKNIDERSPHKIAFILFPPN